MKLLAQRKLLTFGVALFFIVLVNVFSGQARGFFGILFAPLQEVAWKSANGISDFFEIFPAISAVKEQNDRLAAENQKLVQEILELQEIRKENEQLRQALEVGLKEEFSLVSVRLIGVEIGEDVLIARQEGERTIVQEGMPVVSSSKVVVGIVHEVQGGIVRIAMVTQKDFSFDIKILEQETTGIGRGAGAGKLLLDRIPREKALREGSVITTSSLGGIFPSDLLVGKIAQVVQEGADPFQQATVDPFFETEETGILFVITNPIQ